VAATTAVTCASTAAFAAARVPWLGCENDPSARGERVAELLRRGAHVLGLGASGDLVTAGDLGRHRP
jgi:hypothetical protein